MGLIRFLMMGTNIFFWAFGATFLGIGIWLAVDPDAFDSFDATGMNDAMWAAAVYTMIAIGALVFLVGFLGFCGAFRGGKGRWGLLLKLYIVLVGIVMLAELVIIILAGVFWDSIDDSVRRQMADDVHNDYAGPEAGDPLSISWDKMQHQWKCCGSYNFTDYKGSKWASPPSQPVPYTCCVYKKGASYRTSTVPEDVVENYPECMAEGRRLEYTKPSDFKYLNARGCYNELSAFFDQNAAIIIGVTCGVIGLQILGIISSCCMMKGD